MPIVDLGPIVNVDPALDQARMEFAHSLDRGPTFVVSISWLESSPSIRGYRTLERARGLDA
jgi:hypothetical protein